MKVIPIALEQHQQLGTTTLAFALHILRSDGFVLGFTSASRDSTPIDGVVYRAGYGLDVSGIVHAAGSSVDNLELTVVDAPELFTWPDIRAGLWDAASFVLFRYNHQDVSQGVEPILGGVLGEFRPNDATTIVELRGLQQYLRQPLGAIASPTCRARLFDSRCTVDPAAYTFTSTITATSGLQQFTDSSRTEDATYFDNGDVEFLTGDCAGYKQVIKSFSGGVFTLALPMTQALAPGDSYRVRAGCLLRRDEDCSDKFNNAANFQGEPDAPLTDAMTQGA